MAQIDQTLHFIIKTACRILNPEKILLFGSRARGDHTSRSDYDIAIQTENDEKWHLFVAECEENTPTLCELNLLRFDTASSEIQNSILKEGVVLYDKHKATPFTGKP